MTSRLSTALALCLLLLSPPAAAETRYVTDQFEITLRSGTSVSNSILAMLKSGQALTLLEEDQETRYSLVRTKEGKQGYVLTRYLMTQPSGRTQYSQLQSSTEQMRTRVEELTTQIEQHRLAKENDEQIIEELRTSLKSYQQEYSELQETTRDTMRILKQNESLQNRVNDLDVRLKRVTAENLTYKDKTAMDWFVRGAAVSLVAFLLGILVTRIRWKKRDSWSDY